MRGAACLIDNDFSHEKKTLKDRSRWRLWSKDNEIVFSKRFDIGIQEEALVGWLVGRGLVLLEQSGATGAFRFILILKGIQKCQGIICVPFD